MPRAKEPKKSPVLSPERDARRHDEGGEKHICYRKVKWVAVAGVVCVVVFGLVWLFSTMLR